MSKSGVKTYMPRYRFPEFTSYGTIIAKTGNMIFDATNNKNHNADLPILAVTQEHGVVPRDSINYNVTVTEKSLENYKVVEKGDFIISLRAFQGGIEYSEYHGICSPAYITLRKKTDISDSYYKHYFKSFRFIRDLNKDIEGLRDGKIITYRQFSSIYLPVPPKNEQEKIAACLSSIDRLISAEEKKLSLLNDYKKSWMQKLFPAEGESMPAWRFPEFSQDGNWKRAAIENECYPLYSGGTPATFTEEYYGGDIPFIRSGEIGKKNTNLFLTKKGLDNSSAKIIEKGDLLLSLYGANSGEVAISPIRGAINQAILCLRHKKNNTFLYYYLLHKKNWIIRKYIQGGQGNLSGEIIKAIELSFPQNLEEHHRISLFLSSIDRLTTHQVEKISKLKREKKSLVQGLFPSMEEIEK